MLTLFGVVTMVSIRENKFSMRGLTSTLRKFRKNVKASTGSMIGKILGLVLGGYIAAYTLPESIAVMSNATNWANTPLVVQTLGGTVVGLIMIIAFIYLLLKEAGMGD